MQGDHLLSVAGVSEQAGSVCTRSLMHTKTHTGTRARAHTHTNARTHTDRQTDRHILTQQEAYTHVLTAESVGSTLNRQALNSYTN